MRTVQRSKRTLSEGPLSLALPITSAALLTSPGSGYGALLNATAPATLIDQYTAYSWPFETASRTTLTETPLNLSNQATQGTAWISSDAWFNPIRDAVYELLNLPNNWDSYGAAPVKHEYAVSAVELLHIIMDQRTPVPAVVPTAPGGIQIEWHTNGIDLEIEIESTSRINVSFEDLRSGLSWEDEITSDLQKLSGVVSTISRA